MFKSPILPSPIIKSNVYSSFPILNVTFLHNSAVLIDNLFTILAVSFWICSGFPTYKPRWSLLFLHPVSKANRVFFHRLYYLKWYNLLPHQDSLHGFPFINNSFRFIIRIVGFNNILFHIKFPSSWSKDISPDDKFWCIFLIMPSKICN